MSKLKFLLCYHTKIWPWYMQNQGIDRHRIIIKNKKFNLELRLYDTRLEIESLYIKPYYRKQKIATQIIMALKKFSSQKKLHLQANYVLLSAVGFWQKMEFTVEGMHATWPKE